MRNCMNDFLNLIKAKTRCIWINTYEEEFVIEDIRELSNELKQPMPLFTYSISSGIQEIDLLAKNKNKPQQMSEIAFLNLIYDATHKNDKSDEDDLFEDEKNNIIRSSNNIFILKDFHSIINNANIKRKIRDIIENDYIKYNPIIVISPIQDIPIELEKLFTVIEYDTPDVNLIRELLEALLSSNQRIIQELTDAEKENIVNSCKGLTMNEIAHIFRLSVVKNKAINYQEIANYKIELIKKSNILEYKIPNSNIDDIGGNKAFKAWIQEVVETTNDEAKAFGCSKAKGYLALGVPGSAKSAMAEALAAALSVPFLKLDMAKIMDCKVGNSEKNIAQAIRMIKSTAPCLLLVDEVEKTLSGKIFAVSTQYLQKSRDD